jgi:hypothetical protein
MQTLKRTNGIPTRFRLGETVYLAPNLPQGG